MRFAISDFRFPRRALFQQNKYITQDIVSNQQ